ncbi:MAG: OsmC family protein [Sphingobacteriales bacterium]|nr:OsmC family protein [Sphingobacteriales bacterium]
MEHCVGTACITVQIGQENYRTEIKGDGHVIISDEPIELGGANNGMNPVLLFLASLGSCTAITLKMYSQRKKWNIDTITVNLSMNVVKSNLQQTSYINRHIQITGYISDEDRNRLLKVADQCPLHNIMSNPINIATNILP